MSDHTQESAQIRETDIVFDCPFCGKSLAIDYRGAGLNVPCTDCGKMVQVPIPEGLEIADIDSSVEEQEIRILNLRKALTEAEQRIGELESQIGAVRTSNQTREQEESANGDTLALVLRKVNDLEQRQSEMIRVIEELRDRLPRPS